MNNNELVRLEDAMTFRKPFLWMWVFLISCVTQPGMAQVSAPSLPYGLKIFPFESAAVADEGHSFGTNPAGPAFTKPSSLEFFQTVIPADDHRGPADSARAIYWSFPNYRYAIEYTALEGGPSSGTISISNSRLVRSRVAFGTNINYHYFSNTEEAIPGTFSLRVGFMARPNSRLSMGLTFDNLLSPEAALESFRTRGRFGIGIRPFGDRFTLTADVESQLITLLDEPTAAFLATTRIEPLQGLQINGIFKITDAPLSDLLNTTGAPLQYMVGMGLTLRLGKLSVGDTSVFVLSEDGSDYTANSFYFAGHGNRPPTAIQPGGTRGQIWQVTLADNLGAPPNDDFTGSKPDSFPLLFQTQRLRKALEQDRVKGVLLMIDKNDGSLAEVQEIRGLVKQLRERGKTVVGYLHQPTGKDLYLASACDRVILHPLGSLSLEPPHEEAFYVRDLLEKIGVEAEVVRRGAYKSSPERLIASTPSQETIEMKKAVLKDLYQQLLEGVSQGRNITEGEVVAAFESGLLTADEALRSHLIDDIRYPDEVDEIFVELLGKKYPIQRDAKTHEILMTRWGPQHKIAVMYLGGVIHRGEGHWPVDMLPGGAIRSTDVVRALKKMTLDGAIKAIVLRVDSPGGDVFASDEIWRAVEKAKLKKPIIVSMGGVAASGGYYVSIPGDVIVAEAASLTGSIGVFAGKLNASGLLGKLNVETATFSPTDKTSGLSSFSRPWSDEERALMERHIDALYLQFKQKVSSGRHITMEEVEALAQGRVWTGRQALERRLIDRLGGLDDAVEIAKERAHLSDRNNVVLEVWPRRSMRETILDNIVSERDVKAAIGQTLIQWGNQLSHTGANDSYPRAETFALPTAP